MPIEEWMNITVKQADVGGTYKLKVFIDGSMVHEVDNPSPNIYERVTAYSSRGFVRPADGAIRNLKIFPGNFSNSFATIILTYIVDM